MPVKLLNIVYIFSVIDEQGQYYYYLLFYNLNFIDNLITYYNLFKMFSQELIS